MMNLGTITIFTGLNEKLIFDTVYSLNADIIWPKCNKPSAEILNDLSTFIKNLGNGTTTVFINPDAGIHPLSQLTLAKVCALTVLKKNIKIAVVTQSPYFIRALTIYAKKCEIDLQHYTADNELHTSYNAMFYHLFYPLQCLEDMSYAPESNTLINGVTFRHALLSDLSDEDFEQLQEFSQHASDDEYSVYFYKNGELIII